MEKARVIELAAKIDGWMGTDELEWLYETAKKVQPGHSWIEIGCWKGRSFLATAMGLPQGSTIVGVDHHQGNAGSVAHWETAPEFGDWVKDNFDLTRKLVKHLTYVHTYYYSMKSEDFLKRVAEQFKLIGGIFIDGDHNYGPVKTDIVQALRVIAPTGIICGHDYNHPDVSKAVDELLPEAKKGPGALWHCTLPSAQ